MTKMPKQAVLNRKYNQASKNHSSVFKMDKLLVIFKTVIYKDIYPAY